MNWRGGLAAVGLAMAALWWTILQTGDEYRHLPQQFRSEDFEPKEPTESDLEKLRKSIEKAARLRAEKPPIAAVKSDAGTVPEKAFDAGLYETWVDQELLRRAATGESIPSDGSFDPNEALERLKNGESRDDVLGQPAAKAEN